jgi:hypothetical protein
MNIPDDKIPQDRRVFIKCPRCEHKLFFSKPESRIGISGSVNEESTQPGAPLSGMGIDYDELDIPLDYYGEGVKLALILEEAEQTEKIKGAVEKLGYLCVSALNGEDAILKIQFYHFGLIILSDHFEGGDLQQSKILDVMNNLPMSIRRRVYLALIGDGFNTLDQMTAFALSANVVINREKLDHLTDVLRRALSDHEKFYRVFVDTLAEVGKA